MRSFADISPEVAMTYTLWGRDRLLGHTDLDLPHVQPHVRLGFVEPTEEGKRLLPDAAGVPATTAALHRARGMVDDRDDAHRTQVADFNSACDRREALNLELRDETGGAVPCWFIRIYDLQDESSTDEDTEGDTQEFDDAFDDELEDEFEGDTDFDGAPTAWLEDDCSDASWQPPDERWDTMQYHIQVYLYDPGRGDATDVVIEPEA
jgi:hypothetical protein